MLLPRDALAVYAAEPAGLALGTDLLLAAAYQVQLTVACQVAAAGVVAQQGRGHSPQGPSKCRQAVSKLV